ncbi:MAG: hypothetical protein SFU56_18220 [Capsulimonadales bacterium]|nr:hypothetical protein [Capsulimonadales bacterium]
MANIRESLKRITELEGILCAALVDLKSGITLAIAAGGPDTDVDAAAHVDILRAKLRANSALSRQDCLEDILITSATHYTMLRLVGDGRDHMLFVELNRQRANLGMIRYRLKQIEEDMII